VPFECDTEGQALVFEKMKDHPNRFCKEYDILGEKQLIPKKYDE
jgi:hypothetical protein